MKYTDDMTYWRCQCGKREYWETGAPPAVCQGCEQCGTTFSMGSYSSEYSPRGEHDWGFRCNSKGVPTVRVCRRCYQMEEIKQADA